MPDVIAIACMSIVHFSSMLSFADAATASSGSASEQPGSKNNAQPVGSSVDESRTQTIKSIVFVGNKKYKDSVLRQRIDLRNGDYLDPVLAEAGRRTIEEIYKKIGYTFAEVHLDWEKLKQGEVEYTIDEGPRVQIAAVTFSGNKAIRMGTLENVVKLQKKKWFYWPFYYTEQAVQQDKERLERLYYTKGFLDYNITAKTEFTEDRTRVRVTFVIEEGPAYHVHRIIFTGNEYFDDETLRRRVEVMPGQVYVQRDLAADTARLVKLYRQRGFIDASVDQGPQFVPELGPDLVNVEFRITEGEQFRIGRIDITGNEVTQDRTVRRVLDEYGFMPGRLYDADIAPKQGDGKLEKYVRRMVLAQEVMIRPVTPESGAPGQKDVKVDMTEQATGAINPGIGVSSNYGVIGQLIYRQDNFDISDRPESFKEFMTMKAFRGAGQSLRIALEPGTEMSVYSVNFSDPYWRDRPIRFNLSGSSYERYRESYDEGRLRGFVGFEKRLEKNWRRSISFRAENVDVRSIDYDAPKAIRDVEGDNALVGAEFGVGRDMRDDFYDPTSGYVFNTSYEQLTGEQTFGILGGSYVKYATLFRDELERETVLAVKLRAGTTVGDAPPFEKFYGGGTTTYGIRGFEYRGISPRGLQVFSPHLDPNGLPLPQRIDPIGSDWIFLANTEVTVPLVGENFHWLIFVDSGTVETGPYRLSVGTGIQIKIPYLFGPVPMRFELALPIRKDDDDETQTFSFSMGRLF
jgi:outer membrane protein insertion porin family